MRKAWTLLILLATLTGLALGQNTPSKEEFLQAVNAFERDPLTEQVDAQLKTMVDFTRDSPDVDVVICEANFPVVTEKDTPDPVGRLLLAAFMGGNSRAQLQKGKKGDQSYAGVKLMLSVYDKLKARTDYRSAGLDKLAELESKGQLASYLKKNVKTHK